jgi:tRNA(Ile)-lysidine synthase
LADHEAGDAPEPVEHLVQDHIQERVEAAMRAAVERDDLLPAAGAVIAAVSGGADSLCLLGALAALCGPDGRWPRVELVAAHLDHGLRGDVARAEGAYVAERAADLGLRCHLGARDVAERARREHRSVEDAARRARYAFLREVARAEGAARICVGHTRDDQVETLVLHWLRGSALAGLAGMRPLAGDLARPLLDLTHADALAYCAARGWTPCEDPSNQDRRYLRNRVRHDLLPLLRTYNPRLDDTLLRNARALAADEAYLAAAADRAWAVLATVVTDDAVTLDGAALAALPGPQRRRVLVRAAARLTGGEPALEARHLALLEDLLARPADIRERALHLPMGLLAMREGDRLALRRRLVGGGRADEAAGPVSPGEARALPVPGSVVVPGTGWRVRAEVLDPAAGSAPPGLELPESHVQETERLRPARGTAEALGRASLRAYLDADAAGTPLTVRTWHPGDRFRPFGMTSEKKLQDYFVDAKVPRAERGRIPLVFGPSHLVWVGGHRPDDRAAITPATRRVLALRLEPN